MTDFILTANANNIMTVSVWRGAGDCGEFERFQVPAEENQTILDVVIWIQQHADATLSYRYACRVGMCGSCAMMVNGQPRWTCRTHVKKALVNNAIEIAPLRNLPVIKDLATDMSEFFDKWVQAKGVFHPSVSRDEPVAAIPSTDQKRLNVSAAVECINCAVCYAACDSVSANPEYLGPAALNRAWTLMHDDRDAGKSERLQAVSGKGGCHNCHSHQSCVQYCPNELNPTASIAGLKRETVKSLFKRNT
ncbi:MAG: succinate dehydrogenase/fumarate reductase iron-sulfur subunit [Granulosicoccus sp.]|nr:succinate dehydrogenase/fumarate reductase iron-sulfur subunit [Granulosicoccus sp.]